MHDKPYTMLLNKGTTSINIGCYNNNKLINKHMNLPHGIVASRSVEKTNPIFEVHRDKQIKW
jgi:hypothetical protein